MFMKTPLIYNRKVTPLTPLTPQRSRKALPDMALRPLAFFSGHPARASFPGVTPQVR